MPERPVACSAGYEHLSGYFQVADHLNLLATTIQKKLRVLGVSPPNPAVLRALLDVVYLASLRTEEGRFVKGSVTFADPKSAHLERPIKKRAHYPSFTPFGSAEPLAPEFTR